MIDEFFEMVFGCQPKKKPKKKRRTKYRYNVSFRTKEEKKIIKDLGNAYGKMGAEGYR